jgi:hypothetical protein
MTGASIVPTSVQPALGSPLPFECELPFEDLRDAGGVVLNRTLLPWWDDVVADRGKHDALEILRSGTVLAYTRLSR